VRVRGFFLSFFFLPALVFANGILDRADSQYSKREYDEVGMDFADAARSNYRKVFEKLMNVEGEYARARYLQASHFLILAGAKNKKALLQDGIGQGMQGYLYFERTYGRDPFSSSSLSERGKKIYADLLYWKGMIFAEWIKDQGGGYQSEWNKILNDMRAVVSKGFGCLNDGGAYRVLGQIQSGFECTQIADLNWNGLNILLWAEELSKSGKQQEAIALLKKFVSKPAEQLSLDFIPENRSLQKKAAEKLKQWGVSRNSEYVIGEYVIQLKKKSRFQMQALQQIFHDQVKEFIDDDLVVIRRPLIERSEFAIKSIQEDLKGLPYQAIEPNFIFRISKIPNDPQMSLLWNLHNIGQLDPRGNKGYEGVDVGMEKAWDMTTGNRQIIVGIIDTGVDFKQPDLHENAWVNETEQNGKPGIDDDGNGYVDDLNGYDFLNDKAEIVDDHGHGTHVAGVIGARGNDGFGIAGINWNVRIMSLKFLGANGGGDLAAAVKAIRYATKMGAHITNNSWGSGDNSLILKNAIQEASDAGSLFVAAAGNSGENSDVYPQYPAGFNLPNLIAVAAINNRGQLSNFSNFGAKSVHVGAPGENIFSTLPSGFDSWSGTSMAAPHVAGVAALVWGNEPRLKMQLVKERILSTAKPLAGLRGRTVSGGIVSAYSALTNTHPGQDPYDPAQWESMSWSLSSLHQYQPKTRFEYEFKVPGAKLVTVHFSKFQIEESYDRVFFFDQKNNFLGKWSGAHHDEYAPFAEGETLRIQFLTDQYIQDYGFDIDRAMFKKEI